MTDTNTLALHLDKTTYVEGDPILITFTGTVTRTTVTTDVVGLDGTTTTGETFHADQATLTHTHTQDMLPVMTAQPLTATLGGTAPIVATFTLSDGTAVTASTPYPTVTAKPPVLKFPGDVQPGHVRWGCADGSNTVPTAHETVKSVGIRRTYWTLSNANIASSLTVVQADATALRVPWVSYKPDPFTWASIGQGAADSVIAPMLAKMAAVKIPVFLTPHHEPDEEFGGSRGTLADWQAMYVRYRKLITASGATNIALAPVFMSWSFSPQATGNHKGGDNWFIPGCWDFVGFDPYLTASGYTSLDGATVQPGDGFNNARAWAKSHGLKIALAEWGDSEHNDANAVAFQNNTYQMCIDSATSGLGQIIGAAYFDVGTTNALTGSELAAFNADVAKSTSVLANQS